MRPVSKLFFGIFVAKEIAGLFETLLVGLHTPGLDSPQVRYLAHIHFRLSSQATKYNKDKQRHGHIINRDATSSTSSETNGTEHNIG